MNWPLLLSIFGVLVIFAAITFVYTRKADVAAVKKLDELAKKLGLTFDKGSLKHEPSLKGTYRDVPLVVESVVQGSGASLIYTTTYTASLNGLHIPLDLIAYPEGFLSKLGKAFGGEDIQLDDAELDEAFIIKGTSHHNVRQFFARPNVKACFLQMASEEGVFRFENKSLVFELPHRLLEEEERLKSHLDKIVVYANTINYSAGSPPDLKRAEQLDSDSSDPLGESTTLEVFVPKEKV